MTDYQASLMAYSYMGRIHVAYTVQEFRPSGEANSTLLQHSTDVPDDGTTDPGQYLKEALIAALEAL